jgi:hypothetical protein
MTWTSFAIAPRRRLIATALMYGLSLTVRLTSAAGEEGRVALQAAQCAFLTSTPFTSSRHFADRSRTATRHLQNFQESIT